MSATASIRSATPCSSYEDMYCTCVNVLHMSKMIQIRNVPDELHRTLKARAAERVLAVGTTTVRVLETVALGGPPAGRTELFITPGFTFRRTNALLTNFHLPRSTLLALVMAFAGVEETLRLYRLAIEEGYRFYSFGDAMLVR